MSNNKMKAFVMKKIGEVGLIEKDIPANPGPAVLSQISVITAKATMSRFRAKAGESV